MSYGLPWSADIGNCFTDILNMYEPIYPHWSIVISVSQELVLIPDGNSNLLTHISIREKNASLLRTSRYFIIILTTYLFALPCCM